MQKKGETKSAKVFFQHFFFTSSLVLSTTLVCVSKAQRQQLSVRKQTLKKCVETIRSFLYLRRSKPYISIQPTLFLGAFCLQRLWITKKKIKMVGNAMTLAFFPYYFESQ